jgi:transcriptional regulator with XRE-family HTH domain
VARIRVGTQFADTAPKAAAAVSATARAGTLAVGQRAATLGDYLRDQRRAAQLSLRQLADQAGVSNPYLSQIERGLRRPSAEVLQQLARALRISAETLYIRAGILEPDSTGERAVEQAVLTDAGLTERQRQVLLDIYSSFRETNGASHEAAAAESGDPEKTLLIPGAIDFTVADTAKGQS